MTRVAALASAALALVLTACGARTGLVVDGAAPPPRDAGSDTAPPPRDLGGDASSTCDYGELVATVDGSTVWWASGGSLPAGHYRLAYVDGCMKYSPGQGWTVNAYADGSYAFWLVSGDARVAIMPGTPGIFPGSGGFTDFDECVRANGSDPVLDLDFDGGRLGVQLVDAPYGDNVDGVSGRNPTWKLASCP